MTWHKDFNVDGGIRDKVDARITEYHNENRERGKTSYGPDFAGEPLEQGFEEAFDLAFYMQTEIQRRDHIFKKLIKHFTNVDIWGQDYIINFLEITNEKYYQLVDEIAQEDDKEFSETNK